LTGPHQRLVQDGRRVRFPWLSDLAAAAWHRPAVDGLSAAIRGAASQAMGEMAKTHDGTGGLAENANLRQGEAMLVRRQAQVAAPEGRWASVAVMTRPVQEVAWLAGFSSTGCPRRFPAPRLALQILADTLVLPQQGRQKLRGLVCQRSIASRSYAMTALWTLTCRLQQCATSSGSVLMLSLSSATDVRTVAAPQGPKSNRQAPALLVQAAKARVRQMPLLRIFAMQVALHPRSNEALERLNIGIRPVTLYSCSLPF